MADPPSSGGPKFRIVQGRGLGESRPQQPIQQQNTPQISNGPSPSNGSSLQNIPQKPVAQAPLQPLQQTPPSQLQQCPPAPIQQVPVRQGPSPVMAQNAPTPVPAPSPAPQQGSNTGNVSDEQSMVSKCVRFFKTLIQLSQQPDQQQGRNTAGRVKDLVTHVIYGMMPAEEFTVRLQEALKSQAQPHLLPFLQKTLPFLRTALQNGEVVIDGIVAPSSMTPMAPPLGTTLQNSPQAPATQGSSNLSQGPPSVPSHTSSPLPPATPQQQIQPSVAPQPQQLNTTMQQPQQAPPQNQVQFQSSISTPPNLQVGPSPFRQIGQQQTTQSLQSEEELKPLANQRIQVQSVDVPGQQMHPVPQQQTHEEQEVLQTRQFVDSSLKSVILRPEEIMKKITKRMNEACYVDEDLLALISDATEYRMREMISELGIMAEHRLDPLRLNPSYMQIDDAKSQLKWIENLDRQQEEMRESREKEAIIRMSKSKSIGKDTLEKAKEMQRADAEAKRNRDANAAAIAALGGTRTKQQKWDSAGGSHAASIRPRTVRVNMRDLHTVLASDTRCRKSALLHKLSLAAPQIDPSL